MKKMSSELYNGGIVENKRDKPECEHSYQSIMLLTREKLF